MRIPVMKNSCLFPSPLPNFLHYKLGEGLGMRLGKLGMRSSQHITRLLPKLSPWNEMEYIVETIWS